VSVGEGGGGGGALISFLSQAKKADNINSNKLTFFNCFIII